MYHVLTLVPTQVNVDGDYLYHEDISNEDLARYVTKLLYNDKGKVGTSAKAAIETAKSTYPDANLQRDLDAHMDMDYYFGKQGRHDDLSELDFLPEDNKTTQAPGLDLTSMFNHPSRYKGVHRLRYKLNVISR